MYAQVGGGGGGGRGPWYFEDFAAREGHLSESFYERQFPGCTRATSTMLEYRVTRAPDDRVSTNSTGCPPTPPLSQVASEHDDPLGVQRKRLLGTGCFDFCDWRRAGIDTVYCTI
jgi:hypothetical protein